MASYLERYLQGEYIQVWAELVALGDQIQNEPLSSDAWAVAYETMRRVRQNIERMIPRLRALGYIFLHDQLPKERDCSCFSISGKPAFAFEGHLHACWHADSRPSPNHY